MVGGGKNVRVEEASDRDKSGDERAKGCSELTGVYALPSSFPILYTLHTLQSQQTPSVNCLGSTLLPPRNSKVLKCYNVTKNQSKWNNLIGGETIRHFNYSFGLGLVLFCHKTK